MLKYIKILILSLLLIIGCSGGSHNNPTILTGIFVDSPVEGLTYETSTQSGMTNSRGEFNYIAGETVTFYLADILLGSCSAREKISPFDLVNGIITDVELVAVNECRLLQSLDYDTDLENGITINEYALNEIKGRPIKFDMSCDDFTNDPDVRALFGALNGSGRAFSAEVGIRQLRTKDQALAHLRYALGLDDDTDDDTIPRNTYYLDADGDGYGNPNITIINETQPYGYVSNNLDCNDSYASIHPGATEVLNDGIDQDCDGSDEHPVRNCYQDADGDGYGNPYIYSQDISCGYGYVTDNTDCNDNNPNINPGAMEVYNDGIDQDCDGNDTEPLNTYYYDGDGDGYGNPNITTMAICCPQDYVTNGNDPDDSDPNIP